MIARLTRLLLIVQLTVAVAFASALQRIWTDLSLLSGLFIGMGCIVLIRAAITANNFRLATGVPDPVSTVALGIGGTLRLYAGELHATLVSSSWTMPFIKPRIFVAHDSVLPPVLLVHGYGCNGRYWWHLSKQLKMANITHYAVDLEPVLCAIDCYEPQITAAMKMMQTATGQHQIVMVGHSMGGLVARDWIRVNGGDCVAKLITLGTPHSGTMLARYGLGENSRQMLPAGAPRARPWLTQLNSQIKPAVSTVSIYSLHDNIIAPRTSSHLPGAHNIVLTGIGHVALGSHPAVMSCVVKEIGNARKSSG